MSCKDHKKCHTETHTFGTDDIATSNGVFSLIPGENPIFEDVTCNHNKTLIDITNLTAGVITITIRTRGCHRDITEMLSAGLRRVFQVEDFESLTINAQVAGGVNVIVQKTFCICCEEEKEESSSSSSSHRKHQKKGSSKCNRCHRPHKKCKCA
ncbi:hypothetical protein QUF79_17545 [Fictibacillus enclensis]|uniref:hypothetical protein n=1 Tax=Fictibacillus enclensis TaxID=1017270 RepID=UPI0025A0C978|nr:hypothetical protein [Fictibacillus enclensis]MDM5199821.1 hypothetical protein [Fictibacillus enclensis]